MPLTLTPAEVAELTRRERPAAQARVLRALGIPFKPHPTDPVLIVSRAAAEAVLGVKLEEPGDEPSEWEVNIDRIRQHGKAPVTQ
jgi:uncharacterized protein DUF4224